MNKSVSLAACGCQVLRVRPFPFPPENYVTEPRASAAVVAAHRESLLGGHVLIQGIMNDGKGRETIDTILFLIFYPHYPYDMSAWCFN